MPSSEAPPAADAGRDPVAQAAVTLFTYLAVLAVVAAVAGLPFWHNKVGGTAGLLTLAAGAASARLLAVRGHAVAAMHAFAVVNAAVAFPMMAMSTHLAVPTVVLMTFLPTYAVVCGSRWAFGLGGAYLACAVALQLAESAGLAIPKRFDPPPAAEIAAAAVALAGVVGPLALMFGRLRAALARADTEIARRAAVEVDLARAKDFAERLIEDANVIVLGLDDRGEVVIFNEMGERITGWARGELLGRDWFGAVVPPEEAEARRSTHARRFHEPDLAGEVENTIVARSGERRLIYWRHTLVPDAAGRTISVSLGMDVTERRRAEAELADYRAQLEARVAERTAELAAMADSLRAAGERLQAIFDAASAGILLTRDRVIETCNRSLERMIGYAPGELAARPTRMLAGDPTAWAAARDDLYATTARGDTYSQERLIRRRDGSTFWGRLSARALDPSDPAKGIVGLLEDITADRAMRAETESARELAEEAARAKSSFLANMSHEIRTPLNAVIGIAHLIRRGGLTAEQSERLGKLEGAASHLLGIINAILDLSKIDAGKFTLEERPVRVESLVANAASMLDDRAQARRLRIVSEIENMPRDLVGDPTRLQQALLNYANNAIKFTDGGTVTLRVKLVEQDPATALVRFEVQDTGVGIAPAVLPRLFSAFEQGDGAAARRAGGTGLGLAITRKLAELMGGEAGATSVPGVGSTFWFTARLKRSRDAAPPVEQQGDAKDSAAVLRSAHAGARILVAEDNAINREVAKALLEDAGLVVELAEDGVEAVEMARQREYGAVLMDMQMPNMDGLAATREIRKTRPAGTLPIIAMTANAFSEDRARCYEAGMDDFVGKPVAPERLYATLRGWLDRRRARAAGG